MTQVLDEKGRPVRRKDDKDDLYQLDIQREIALIQHYRESLTP